VTAELVPCIPESDYLYATCSVFFLHLRNSFLKNPQKKKNKKKTSQQFQAN